MTEVLGKKVLSEIEQIAKRTLLRYGVNSYNVLLLNDNDLLHMFPFDAQSRNGGSARSSKIFTWQRATSSDMLL